MSSDKLPTKLISTVECKQGAVRAVRFNIDGNYCLSCGSDKSVKLWNPHRGLLLKAYQGHGYEVLDAVSSCDNSQFTSCGRDKCVILWEIATGQILRKFRGHIGSVNCVRFNEEATVILSGAIDASVRTWDCRSRRLEPIQVLDEAKDSVSSIAVSDHEILTGSVDGKVRRYDLRMGQLYADCVAKPVTSVNFTKDGQCVLASSLDSTVRLLDKDSGELLGEYAGHRNTEYKIDSCLTNTDTHIVSGSEDGKVYFWDLVEGTMVEAVDKAGHGAVYSLSYHATEPCLLTASATSYKVWRPQSY